MQRRHYSRADLSELQALDRAAICEAFGSFDEHDLADDAFVLRAADLLDPDRVPGLA